MRLLVLSILAAPTLAAADPHVSLYHPGGMLLVELGDRSLVKLVGSGTPVRCFKEADGFTGILGAAERAIEGCYVGIARDGQLVPPPVKKRWVLDHLTPTIAGTFTVGKRADGALDLRISGAAGNAIGLWVNCDAVASSALTCRPVRGMLGQIGWDIEFVVGKGGAVRAPTP